MGLINCSTPFFVLLWLSWLWTDNMTFEVLQDVCDGMVCSRNFPMSCFCVLLGLSDLIPWKTVCGLFYCFLFVVVLWC